MKGKIIFNGSEADLIENAINLSHSGYQNKAAIMIGFGGMIFGWKVDDVIYYLGEAEIKEGAKE